MVTSKKTRRKRNSREVSVRPLEAVVKDLIADVTLLRTDPTHLPKWRILNLVADPYQLVENMLGPFTDQDYESISLVWQSKSKTEENLLTQARVDIDYLTRQVFSRHSSSQDSDDGKGMSTMYDRLAIMYNSFPDQLNVLLDKLRKNDKMEKKIDARKKTKKEYEVTTEELMFDMACKLRSWHPYKHSRKQPDPFEALREHEDQGLTLYVPINSNKLNPRKEKSGCVMFAWQEKLKSKERTIEKMLDKAFS